MGKCLPDVQEALGQSPALQNTCVKVHVYDLITVEVKVGESGVQGLPWLHSEFEANVS